MKIHYQLNENDCGIAVTQTLIEHFYSYSPSREELINHSFISERGISLWDLEKINERYGIKLESFEATISELQALQSKKLLILILKNTARTHYVIAKKGRKNHIIIHDPIRGKFKLTYQQLSRVYGGILMTATPISQHIKLIHSPKKPEKYWLDKQKTAKNIFLEFLIISITFFTTLSLRNVFGESSELNWYSTVGWVVFSISLTFLCLFFLQFTLSQQISENKEHYFKKIMQLFFLALKNKNNAFFHKFGMNPFLTLQTHIENISNFYAITVQKAIINLIILIGIVCYMASIHAVFILVCGITIITHWIYSQSSLAHNKKNNPKINYLEMERRRIYYDLGEFLEREIDIKKQEQIIYRLKNLCGQQFRALRASEFHKNIIQKFNITAHKAVNLITYLITSFLHIKGQITFGDLFITLILFSFLSSASSELISQWQSKVSYEQSLKIFQEFVKTEKTISNPGLPNKLFAKSQIHLNNITLFMSGISIFIHFTIKIKSGSLISGPSGSGKSTIFALISRKISPQNGSIVTPEWNYSDSSVIYQTNKSWFFMESLNSVLRQVPKTLVSRVKKIFIQLNIDYKSFELEKLSSGQRQFVNLLPLLHKSKQIILLDECLSHIHLSVKKEIVEYLYRSIACHNFLVWTEHNLTFKTDKSWYPIITLQKQVDSEILENKTARPVAEEPLYLTSTP